MEFNKDIFGKGCGEYEEFLKIKSEGFN